MSSHPTSAVLIMAAGRGERMQAVGPKPLVSVGGKPLITYSLGLSRHFDPGSIIVFLSPEAESAVRFLKEGEKHDIVQPLGTATDAIKALKLLPPSIEDLLICHADDAALYPIDIFETFYQRFKETNVNIAIATTTVSYPLSLGALDVGEDGYLKAINTDRSLPSPKTIVCGLFLIKRPTLERYFPQTTVSEKGERSIAPTLLQVALHAHEPIATFELPEGQWSNINTPEELARANNLLGGR